MQGSDLDKMKQVIANRLAYGKQFWNPLHQRQDYWMQMYQMLDMLQQMKPLGYRRFMSNQPRTAVDAAISIGTRNETGWHIDLTGAEDEMQLERRKIGRIERTLSGVVYAIDDTFAARGEPPFWTQVWFQALMRGWIWGKTHVTTAALEYSDSPLISEIYDSRTVYPFFDTFGLNSVIIEKPTSLGDMCMMYPEKFAEYEAANNYDPFTPVIKIEFWSNNRGNMPGIYGCLAVVGQKTQFGAYQLLTQLSGGAGAMWVQEPYAHGYTPRSLPVIGVPVNGVNIKMKPPLNSVMETRLTERADITAMNALAWNRRDSWVAETGRSILSSVEDHVPQYNELIATIFQHLSVGTYGTWISKTPSGEFPKFRPGIEAKVALRPDENIQRVTVEPISPDAYRLVQLLQEEKNNGTLANILQASSGFQGTGVLFQQMANAALNGLAPFNAGVKMFGQRWAQSVLAQFQEGAGALKKFELVTPTAKNTYFRIEFDPKVDLDKNRHYRPIPQNKPALPDDLSVRMQAARLALDPRRPILSLHTVLEEILQLDDPETELDKIWEDIAQTDPVIVLEQIANALDRRGEKEMAARLRENEFRAKFLEDLQFRQQSGNIPPSPGGPPQMGPESGVPGSTQTDNTTTADAAAGAGLVGQMGETAGV